MKRLLTKVQVERYLKKAAFYGGPSYMSLNNKSVYDNIAIGMEYEQLEKELKDYFRNSKEKSNYLRLQQKNITTLLNPGVNEKSFDEPMQKPAYPSSVIPYSQGVIWSD